MVSIILPSCQGKDVFFPDVINPDEEVKLKLIDMEFLSDENPIQLIDNVYCSIEGDSLVSCWIPHFLEDKSLIPHFSYEGDKVFSNDVVLISGETAINFSRPVSLTITGEGGAKKVYTVLVHSYTGLPVCWITTENRAPIESKEEYVNARIRIVEDVVTRAPGEVFESEVAIKGRGNTTWLKFPKKPYRLKFENKVSLLDEPKDKSWVLLANYADKTMLRNDITFFISSISALDYTPTSHFVEIMLNGSYMGTYQLTDKLKISKNRVNVGDDGFLLEIDDYAPYENDARYFLAKYLKQPCINIKDPEVEYDDENYTYAKEFVLAAEEALFSETFTDLDNGWQKYMDINSFVDYYIVNEISKNTDAMWASSYMSFKKGGKLTMGPVWDYDLAYGNYSGNMLLANYEGFKVLYNPWYERLFRDPVFVERVKERYDYFYEKKKDIAVRINTMADYLRYSAQENNNKWETLYAVEWPNVNAWGSYENEVSLLKEWVFKRMDWLKAQFDAM